MVSLKRSTAWIGIFFLAYLAFSCNSNKHSHSAVRFNVGDTVIVSMSSMEWELCIPKDSVSKECCIIVKLKASRPDTTFGPQALLKSDPSTSARPDTQWDPSIKDTSWMKRILIIKEVYTDCEDE